MAQLIIAAATDFRGGATETNIDEILFTNNVGDAGGYFDATQFGPGLIANDVLLTGTAQYNFIELHVAGSYSAAAWQFANWGFQDTTTFQGSAGGDTITGSIQGDNIFGNGGLDHLFGGAGSDDFFVQEVYAAGTTIDGGTNTAGIGDAVYIEGNGFMDLTTIAFSNVERLVFGSFGAVTAFFTGDQIAASGFAEIYGDNGTVQTLSVQGTNVDLGAILFQSWEAQDVSAITGTGSVANTLTGSHISDFIDGNDFAADTIEGGFGADTMQGRGGDDRFLYDVGGDMQAGESIDGGADHDEIVLQNAGAIDFTIGTVSSIEAIVFANSATATFLGSQFGGTEIVAVSGSLLADTLIVAASGSATLASVAFATWTDGSDKITVNGSALADDLTGSNRIDTLFGGGGDDTLDGGLGADTLRGGTGNDTYMNPTGDSIVEAAPAAGGTHDLVFSAVSYNLASAPNVEDITLGGIANINAIGGTGNNRLTGNGGSNTLNGGGGNDVLAGLGGTDTLNGGSGNDLYLNPESLDIIGEAAGAAGGLHDRIQTLSSFNIGAVSNVEDITLVGAANVNAIGNNLANILVGNPGNNTILGGGGADTLTGGAGNDTMNGGGGADLFKFAVAGTGNDTIGGFETALDRFDLAGGSFSARAEAGGSTTLTHAGGTIVVTGLVGLSVTQWNALVDNGARTAPHDDALHHPASLGHFGAADFLFA